MLLIAEGELAVTMLLLMMMMLTTMRRMREMKTKEAIMDQQTAKKGRKTSLKATRLAV